MKLHSQGKFLKKGIVFTAIASMLMITACSANGSEPKYPTKSIEGIVPFGAGGGTDLVSRAIATVAEKKLGQGIAITNKPGATATVGTQYVYDKKADGYTLLFSAENPGIYGVLQLSERGFHEFYPVNIMGRGIATITVPKDSKYKTLNDLIQDAKTNPGKVKMGSSGPGGLSFMVTTMINSISDTKFNMVPFDGDGPILTALLGNHIDVSVVALSAAIENAKAGKVRVLAVVNDEKVKELPDVPAITETLPDMKKFLPWGPFYGAWVKKDTPDSVKQSLVKAFSEAQKDPEFLKLLEKMAVVPMGISGDEAEKFWRDWQSTSAWLLQDAGAAKVSPETLKIPRKQ
ncbi:tripartite tricarboxylate transporter substrate binding protein [Paenibacillus validus]|uniref:Tripartite tricarboxylate transporter substrate binding protein n=1 Tax=Paenibacillus validus TaxID=44253 RepID=A0A7X2ZC03_9BACL|nr:MULTISPECIES: tripartite tricarboxylate transporter substrate binding protein [Paenibacillus]MED4599532.1 tripartite tricarboxylate transporter substrate binding protein [Paenibacillus validus]MED4607055.1 tripartite tricarboxylate transporter substrate binding protein [Paenibacillus validus]MUG72193.1 tripartite tricarboxylate transporter substrate binding protein [Paenibacillus validus]